MSIARRMTLASAGLAVLVGLAFGTLILAVSTLRDATEQEAHSKDVTASTIRLEKLVIDLETGVRGLALSGDERFLQPYTAALAELPKGLAEFERLSRVDPTQRGRAAALVVRIREYERDFATPLVGIARESPSAARLSIVTAEGKRRTDDIRARFDAFLRAENELAAAGARTATHRSDRALLVGAGAVAASTVLIFLFGVILSRSITGPVRAVASGASRLAGGELSLRLPASGPGEVGELTRSFNAMAQRLQESRVELERQNARLRESERLKTELISIVSHELRTPLASVIGFTSLLLQRDFDAQTRRHYLGIVDSQARRLASLLEDFLDVQQIESGRLELGQELVEMGSLLAEQVQLYAAESPRHRLRFSPPERPLPVRGDPDRLAQVVGNLLSNAIKYSPEGGLVELSGQLSEGAIKISISDEGLGIPRDQQSRIFTKFFRGEAGASGISGTGLGLAVSREIVEAHGGRIGFVSAPGEGSTFWLELPEATTPPAGANGDRRKETG